MQATIDKTDVTKQLDQLDQEYRKLKERHAELDAEAGRRLADLRAEVDRINKRAKVILAERKRLALIPLIGEPVRSCRWWPAGDRRAVMNDAVGTLVKVNRKYARIDFGEHGEWDLPFDWIKFVADASRHATD